MQGKRIVLINDQPGYGKVALSAMPPILARMGYELMLLPTAIISNTLDYGRFAVRDMTDYMRECVKVWKELKLNYEAACTGYIVSEAQAEFLREYLSDQKKTHGIRVYVDPIMGDRGRLYNSVTEKNVESMRRLCAIADVICPNMTEAQYLAGRFQGREDLTQEEMDEIIEALRQMGIKEAPCIRLDHLTDKQRREYTIAHNKTTMDSGFDKNIMKLELPSGVDVEIKA